MGSPYRSWRQSPGTRTAVVSMHPLATTPRRRPSRTSLAPDQGPPISSPAKGGTGKTTVAAALALRLATGGLQVLLVEVEGRRASRSCSMYRRCRIRIKIATADGGGHVMALAIDIEAAFMEYLDMFYNLGIAGRAMRRVNAINSRRRSHPDSVTCC